LDSRD